MPDPKSSPVLPVDDAARALARGLLAEARSAALATLDPTDGAPLVTRIGLARGPDGQPVTLISTLAAHTGALARDPRAALLLGEPGPKGDPLTHPRLTLKVAARFCGADDPQRATLRAAYLDQNPKAGLYIDFPDFRLVELRVLSGFLNGGFGRAYDLGPADLGLA